LLYAVRKGETCSSIARKFGVTVWQLERANPGLDCDNLQIGQVICIPGIADEFCPGGQLYTVRRGDSMFTIAQRFGIPLSRLIAANPQVPDPDLIYHRGQPAGPGSRPHLPWRAAVYSRGGTTRRL